jgi:YHS domain-containing protein
MKKTLITLIALSAILFAPVVQAESGEATEGKAQTTCPVMGGSIRKSLYVDHDGKRIYVCCKGCISAVKSNPEKYIEKLESDGVKLEKVDGAVDSASDED